MFNVKCTGFVFFDPTVNVLLVVDDGGCGAFILTHNISAVN